MNFADLTLVKSLKENAPIAVAGILTVVLLYFGLNFALDTDAKLERQVEVQRALDRVEVEKQDEQAAAKEYLTNNPEEEKESYREMETN